MAQEIQSTHHHHEEPPKLFRIKGSTGLLSKENSCKPLIEAWTSRGNVARWSFSIAVKEFFGRAVHERNAMQEQLEGRCQAEIEEEAALREHLQNEECRLFSMNVSHENQINVI